MRKRRVIYITAGIFATLIVVGLAVSFYYFSIMKKTIEEVTTAEQPKAIYSVYVLNDDAAKRIEDTFNYSYGKSISDLDEASMKEMISKLEAVLEKKPDIINYDNIFMLINGLRDKQVGAIILNEAYKNSISEAEGYEWVDNGIRKLESFEFKQTTENEILLTYEVPKDIPETFILYVSGIDTYGGISARSRSDVNIINVVNTKSKKMLMLATPRDYYVDFSATSGNKDKLTHAGIYGVESSIDALNRLYDINIDYYVKINFTGFVNIIDALGGIEVYSDYDFSVENIKDYHKGYNYVNGIEALAFARERYSFARGDYQRANNQMEVIKAVINKSTSTALLKNYHSIMNSIPDSIETNIPQSHISELIKMQLSERNNWGVTSYTVEGTSSYKPTFSMPGKDLYVIIPDQNSINSAKNMISDIKSSK